MGPSMSARAIVAVTLLALASMAASRPGDSTGSGGALLLAPEAIPGDPPLPKELAGARLRITRCRVVRYGKGPRTVEIEGRLETGIERGDGPPEWILQKPSGFRCTRATGVALAERDGTAFVEDLRRSRLGIHVLGLPPEEHRIGRLEVTVPLARVTRWAILQATSRTGESATAADALVEISVGAAAPGSTRDARTLLDEGPLRKRVGGQDEGLLTVLHGDRLSLLEARDAEGPLVRIMEIVLGISSRMTPCSTWRKDADGSAPIVYPVTATVHYPAEAELGERHALRFVLTDFAFE